MLSKTRDLAQSKDLLTMEQYEQGVEPTGIETSCDIIEDVDEKENLAKNNEEETNAKKMKVEETEG